MTQPKILELAKQGDAKAIASVINYMMRDKDITATTDIKDGCLRVMLESEEVPQQESSVTLIRKLMMKLEISSIKAVKVYGKQMGQGVPTWTESLNLNYQVEETKKTNKSSQVAQQDNQNGSQNLWPVWFPYPIAWLKTFALCLWMAIVLRIAGFWGIVLGAIFSIVANNPGLLLCFLGLALIASVLVFSYVHQLIYRKKPQNWPRWLPSWTSLWEGFYAPVVMIISLLTVVSLIVPFDPFLDCNFNTVYPRYYCRELAQQSYLDEIAVLIWLISAAYLYQIEYLIQTNFILKSAKESNTANSNKPVEATDLEFDRLRGDMGLTQMKKGKVIATQTRPKEQFQSPKNRKLRAIVIFLLLIIVGAASSYGVAKWSEIKQVIPWPIASQVPSPVPSASVAGTPSSIASATSTASVQVESFREAVNHAMSAAKLAQSAKSKDDWQRVAGRWQEAIALMKAVPPSSPNYAVAQTKVVEYQRNLDYAQLAASRAK